MATPFMTDAEFDALEPLMADGWATYQEWTSTSITITRQDATQDTVQVISIGLADRQEQQQGTGSSSLSTELTGSFRAFASEFSRPVRQGDRFTWQGMTCIVVAGPFAQRAGVVSVNFVLRMGNT